MRRALFAFVLAGCNSLFDLQPTDLVEYQRIDAAPLDAPPMCPPSGTPLAFSKYVTQAFSQPIRDYTFSTSSQLAIAQCQQPYEVCEGRLGEPLSKAPGFDAPPDWEVGEPRLSAAGDVALVKLTRLSVSGTKFTLYARGADGRWMLASDTNLPNQFSGSVSQPTRGPDRHVIVVDGSGVTEWVLTDIWRLGATYTNAQLGVASFIYPRISGDGLRMTAYGQLAAQPAYRTLYFDRASISAPWNPAQALTGAPSNINDAVLSDDCSRLYFTALNSVFFVPRLP